MIDNPVVFESKELIYGAAYAFPRTVFDYVHYSCLLKVRNVGSMPVSMELIMVQPFPTYIKMPKEISITAKTITTAYVKVIRLFKEHKLEFRG